MDIEVTFGGGKKINASINGEMIYTDQPVDAGGDGTAPSPFNLFLASIGTCAGIYVKSFLDSRQLSADGIKIMQHLEFKPLSRLVESINLEIQLPADFPEKYKAALINVAELCTVKKHLMHPPVIKVETKTV